MAKIEFVVMIVGLNELSKPDNAITKFIGKDGVTVVGVTMSTNPQNAAARDVGILYERSELPARPKAKTAPKREKVSASEALHPKQKPPALP